MQLIDYIALPMIAIGSLLLIGMYLNSKKHRKPHSH